ncbi:hypothetical protein Goklo_005925, partial [Gossypium klotzschianum]|nr:hypothetical protein [Gossypium klotzschianum]
MERKVLSGVMAIFLLGGWCHCDGCLDHEKTALLQLKHSFNYHNHGLDEWVEGDCCKWKRVECNIFTGRIIRLFLNLTAIEHQHGFFYTYHAGNGVEYYWGKREQWYLNVSLFLPFSRIKESSFNWKFNSWKKGELRAMKLEMLDLSVNFFNNTILSFLALLSNLKFLNIKSNRLEGAIHIKGISTSFYANSFKP